MHMDESGSDAHRYVLAFVVCPASQCDADRARGELPVQDDYHDFVRRSSGFLKRHVCFIDQPLKLLKKKRSAKTVSTCNCVLQTSLLVSSVVIDAMTRM